ncbi:sugar transferase [Tsuneonella sp. HG222]
MNAPSPIAQDAGVRARAPANGLARPLEKRRLQFYVAQIFVDVCIILLAFVMASQIYVGEPFETPFMLPANLLWPIYLTIAMYNRTYSQDSLRDWRKGMQRALTALLISGGLLNFFAFFARINAEFSRFGFVIASVFMIVLIMLSRRVLVSISQRVFGPNPLNLLVINAGGPPVNLPDAYRINAAEQGLEPRLDDPHSLDRFARYVANMDQVLITCPDGDRVRWAMVLKGAGIHGEVTSDYMNEIGALGVIRREPDGLATLLVATGPLGFRARILKRTLDIAVSLGALLVALPILAVAAVLIKLEDGGPVLFNQRRIGRRNQLFSIHKLRSMSVARGDADGNTSASKGDVRVTRIGAFLRKSSIDELPQLFNVLKGDMSLVGPRPHAIGSLAGEKLFWEVDERYWHRHSLRPGLTGLAQIRGFRGATDKESDLTGRLQSDLEYLAGWTIWRDISILFATFRVLAHDRAF